MIYDTSFLYDPWCIVVVWLWYIVVWSMIYPSLMIIMHCCRMTMIHRCRMIITHCCMIYDTLLSYDPWYIVVIWSSGWLRRQWDTLSVQRGCPQSQLVWVPPWWPTTNQSQLGIHLAACHPQGHLLAAQLGLRELDVVTLSRAELTLSLQLECILASMS